MRSDQQKKEESPWKTLICFFLFFGFITYWMKRGDEFDGLLDFLLRTSGLLVTLIIGLGVIVFLGPKWAWPLACAGFLIFFEIFTSAYPHFLIRDLILVGASFFVAIITVKTSRLVVFRLKGMRDFSHSQLAWLSIRFLLICWFSIYLGDSLAYHFSTKITRDRSFSSPKSPVAVCLSGGGYRAALFHAGVLSALNHMDIQPVGLSTVSGGSIIGAFYVRGCSPEDFLRLVQDHRFNLKRELLSPWNLTHLVIATRIPDTEKGFLPTEDFTRTDIQASLLDGVFLNYAKMKNAVLTNGPEILICASDLASGKLVGIHRGGAIMREQLPAAWRMQFVNSPRRDNSGESWKSHLEICYASGIILDKSLSEFVAASGAFPVAFPPFRQINQVDSISRETFVLADGGVLDNMGLTLLKTMLVIAHAEAASELKDITRRGLPNIKADNKNHFEFLRKYSEKLGADKGSFSESVKPWTNVNFIIVSDASAIPTQKIPGRGLSEIGAALDVMYRTSGGQEVEQAENNMPIVLLSPSIFLTKLPADNDFRMATRNLVQFEYSGMETPSNSVQISPHDSRNRTIPPNYSQLETNDLAYLISTLPEKVRKEAENHLSAASEYKSAVTDFQQGKSTLTLNQLLDARNRDLKLYKIFYKQLTNDFRIFCETSTLKDNLESDKAVAIFRLGQFVTVLNKSYIQEGLATTDK